MPARKRAAPDDPVLFSFGVLADVQSGDKDDGVGEDGGGGGSPETCSIWRGGRSTTPPYKLGAC